jgi:uncharacterized membrane protein YagU involved in acid resistance
VIVGLLIVAAVVYSIVMPLMSQKEVLISTERPFILSRIISNIVWMVGVQFILSGIFLSSLCKYIAEHYMIKSEKKGGASGGTGGVYPSK